MAEETRLQFPDVPAPAGPLRVVCPVCDTRLPRDARFCPFDGEPLEGAEIATAADDDLVGRIVDHRYEVVGVIGEGGMGTVYEVRHIKLERAFAMKVLRADLATEAELAARFTREANAAAAVSHPNIVQITDFGTLPTGQPYFVMERVSGSPLDVLMAGTGALPPQAAAGVALGVAEALAAAHAAGIVHRDLKPGNIMVEVGADARGVKVLDFGLAIVAGQSRLTKKGMVFGTPHYMSPEQASGASLDERSDMYALGVVLYQMVTGRVPFEADTFMGVMTKHLHVEPPPPRGLVSGDLGDLDAVILRCLAKLPEDRFASMSELASELGPLARGPTAAAHAAPLASELPDQSVNAAEMRAAGIPAPVPQRRWVVGLVAAVLFALAFGTTWALRRDGPDPTGKGTLEGERRTRGGSGQVEGRAEAALAPPAPIERAQAPPAASPPSPGSRASEESDAPTHRRGPRSKAKAAPKKRLPKGLKSERNIGGGVIVDPWAN